MARGDPMTFPIPDAALDDRLGFVGTAGSGKTYNAGTGLERILASGGRVIVPDPLGVWWGLGLGADGRSPAPWRDKLVVFGGEHGDMPLFEHSGALIGETVAGMAESAILDLSSIGTKAAERRFMLAFLTALYKHASCEPVHLAFDEADMWAPQRLLDKEGEAAKLLGMMETVVRRGRIRGFIPWLITQRPAVLSKDVLSQVDGLVAFKLTSSQDRAALGAWIEGQADKEQGKAILGSLPTLPRGTGVVWLPGRGVLTTAAFPAKQTFDSSRTPIRGERVEKRELKPLNLEALRGKLASIEQEAKASDPKALKAEVAKLQRELAVAQKAAPATAWPDQRQLVETLTAELAETNAALERLTFGATELQRRQDAALAALTGEKVEVPTPPSRKALSHTIDYSRKPGGGASPQGDQPQAPIRNESVPATEGITGPQQRILDAIAWWEAFGITRPTNEQVAFMSGYSPSSGGYKNPKSAARTAGLIEYPTPGLVALTETGRSAANVPDAPTTREELHRRVNERLTGPQRAILAPLLRCWPEEMPNDGLAAAAGYSPTSGGYKNPKSSLRTLTVIDYPSPGQIRAADWLFP